MPRTLEVINGPRSSTRGNRSAECDLVVHSAATPALMIGEAFHLVPVEWEYGVQVEQPALADTAAPSSTSDRWWSIASRTRSRERPPVDDEVADRLRLLVQSVEGRLGQAVVVHKDSIRNAPVETLHLGPRRPDACPVSWAEMGGSELVLQVSGGGRWEMARNVESVSFIEQIVGAVIAGRVTEVIAPGHSKVTVTLGDGTEKSSVVHNDLLGLLPIPFWRSRGRSVSFSAYR